MSMISLLARQRAEKRSLVGFFLVFSALAACIGSLSTPVQGANYKPGKWFLSGGFSFGTIQADELNDVLDSAAPKIPGLIGFHLQGERTLREPDLTLWAEIAHEVGGSASKAGSVSHDRNLSYLAVIPLGINYWFNRTAFVDFGVGLGLGVGLSPSFDASRESGGTTETIELSGGASFLADARLSARFWFSRYIALSGQGVLRIYQPKLESGSTSAEANLVSLAGVVGVTWAIGGTSGLGRNFIEVLPPKPNDEQAQPAAPAPTPAPKAAPVSAPRTKPAPSAPAPKQRPRPAGPAGKPHSGRK